MCSEASGQLNNKQKRRIEHNKWTCISLSDPLGDHYMCCRVGGEFQSRHNTLLQVCSSICRQASHAVDMEVPASAVIPPSTPSSVPHHNLRFDLVIRNSHSQATAADVTVIHPSPESDSALITYSRRPAAAAALRERQKVTKYKNLSRSLGMSFVPLVFETFGTLGASMQVWLKAMAHKAANQGSRCPVGPPTVVAMLVTNWRRRLSCALQKANAALFLRRSFNGSRAHFRGSSPSAFDFSVLMAPRLR